MASFILFKTRGAFFSAWMARFRRIRLDLSDFAIFQSESESCQVPRNNTKKYRLSVESKT